MIRAFSHYENTYIKGFQVLAIQW